MRRGSEIVNTWVGKNILELIGNTPLVKINNLNPNSKCKIYAKLEGNNPGGSIKDRIALAMIEQAEKEGELTKNKTIIEPTSGNTGIGQFLKEYNPNVKIVCAHPVKGHYIQGLKNMEEAIVPSIYDPSMIDDTVMVETEEAFKMTRQLAKKEGVFAGMSSGAAMLAAVETAKKAKKGVIVVIFPDRGDRYLTTDLFK